MMHLHSTNVDTLDLMVRHDNQAGHPPHRDDARGELGGKIQRNVERRTGGRVNGLNVTCSDGVITLRGRCRTQYAKQLAQQAALELADGRFGFVNQILVG